MPTKPRPAARARQAPAAGTALGQKRWRAAWGCAAAGDGRLGTGAGGDGDCWFDEPDPAERRSWAMPVGHGTYRGLDLELLDPADEDELALLIEAQHPELADVLRQDAEIVLDGEPFSPRLHIAMHQVVASQLLADDPPETWQTVRRLAGLGYDWHNIMHMIAAVISDDLYAAMKEQRPFDAPDYARRLNELPGDWPPPQT